MSNLFNSKENRELKILLISVVASVLLLATLGLYLVLGARENFVTASGLKSRLDSVRNFSLRHQDYQEYSNKLSEKWETLDGQIPVKIDLNNLVLEINNLAKIHQVDLQNLQLPAELNRKKQDGAFAQTMQITALGQCGVLLDFMEAVEKMENLKVFSNVQMEAKENDMVLLNGNIKVFSR